MVASPARHASEAGAVVFHLVPLLLALWKRFIAPWEPRPAPPLSLAMVSNLYSEIAWALRAEGARTECERIRGVYQQGHVTVPPLIERLMFDGKTPPEGAAMAMIASMQANAACMAIAGQQRVEGADIAPH